MDILDKEEGTCFISKNKKSSFKAPQTVNEINGLIHQQFDKIREKFGEPSIVLKSLDSEEPSKNSKKDKSKLVDDSLDTLTSPTSDEDYDSYYSSWVESSSAQHINDNSVIKDFLDSDQKGKILGGDNSLLKFVEKPDIRTTKIIQDAMTGNNLLGMMDEQKDVSGSDSLDLFIDPSAIFGSEKHPALLAVLKQLDLTKRKRGKKILT